MRKVFQILCERKYDILMVAADAGQSFGDLTTKYLGRLHKENGTMIAVCTKHYGEMTASAYSSHKDRIPYISHFLSCFNINLLVVKEWLPQQQGHNVRNPDREFRGYLRHSAMMCYVINIGTPYS